MDGNKRIGWLSVVVSYGFNEIHLDAPDDGAFDLVISMVSGNLTFEQAASTLPLALALRGRECD